MFLYMQVERENVERNRGGWVQLQIFFMSFFFVIRRKGHKFTNLFLHRFVVHKGQIKLHMKQERTVKRCIVDVT